MTATHSPGCPALADVRDGCACLLRQTSSTGPASYPPARVLPTSVAPAGEDYGAPHAEPCDCDDCRNAVAAQGQRTVTAPSWAAIVITAVAIAVVIAVFRD